jgi:hypothetical protein
MCTYLCVTLQQKRPIGRIMDLYHIIIKNAETILLTPIYISKDNSEQCALINSKKQCLNETVDGY